MKRLVVLFALLVPTIIILSGLYVLLVAPDVVTVVQVPATERIEHTKDAGWPLLITGGLLFFLSLLLETEV